MFLTLRVPTLAVNNLVSSTINTSNSQNIKPLSFNGIVSADNSIDIDWTRSGVVTSIKNQGVCGGCWAFTAVSDL